MRSLRFEHIEYWIRFIHLLLFVAARFLVLIVFLALAEESCDNFRHKAVRLVVDFFAGFRRRLGGTFCFFLFFLAALFLVAFFDLPARGLRRTFLAVTAAPPTRRAIRFPAVLDLATSPSLSSTSSSFLDPPPVFVVSTSFTGRTENKSWKP
ncbi:MAG: hypothetical protein GY740_20690 [Gammaproteobacteria bacterium]|nr:hypothetical protein [Gammaproteobacteria bacterium]